jgi:hypothetical protein
MMNGYFKWRAASNEKCMKKFIPCLLAIHFLISGCTFNVEVLNQEQSQPTPFPAQSGSTSTPTTVATLPGQPELAFTPTLPPPVTYPNFTNARMGASPEDPNRPTFFPAGTKAVYAIWDYQNMRPGLMIRRAWYWNGQPWITREEAWDFGKYGANGTIRDISIFDNETGLNSGVYQLRLYIDNVSQPIGSGIGTPVTPWFTFNIGTEEKYSGYMSPDYLSAVEVFDERRVVLQASGGISKEIFTASEVPYVSWFPDGRHFLFVDRDRSRQENGTNLGVRDDLWMVEVPSGNLQLLYKNDISFAGRAGPVVSPNGRYIASLEGSGFGDACLVDSRLIFIELASDLRSMRLIQQTEFSGLPSFDGGSVYPVEDGTWQNDSDYLVTLEGTCTADKSQLGPYLFKLGEKTATQVSSAGITSIPGELGWGNVHGKITDVNTGAPIAGAMVTCEHHSYVSIAPALCSGSVVTNADGSYIFEHVFFHDTDSIDVTVQAAGYQPVGSGSRRFTINDMEANIGLYPAQ